MKKSVTLKGLMSAAVGCLLLPLSIAAESRLGDDGSRATAHLLFKIVIPQVLSLDLDDHSAALGTVILIGSGHHRVVQVAACTRAEAREDAAMNCTVSMP